MTQSHYCYRILLHRIDIRLECSLLGMTLHLGFQLRHDRHGQAAANNRQH